MMEAYGSLCDDFYVNMNLSTEMELPHGRETVLHYFERIQKKYPTMRNFYSRGEKQDFVLEEDKDKGSYRWATIEHRRVCSGYVNPTSVETALDQHRLALELAPYMLSVSPLDCEALDVLFGFDFTYRGNHNQLVAEALGVSPAVGKVAGVARRERHQLRAVDHARARRRLPDAVPREHREPHDRLSGPHRRVSGRATQRLPDGPAVRQPRRPTDVRRRHGQARATLPRGGRELYVIDNVLRPLQRAIAMK